MKYLVVYDTSYGNTAKIAGAIKAGLGADAEVRGIETLRPGDLDHLDLLIVGSPTQGGRPTQSMDDWLRNLPAASKEGRAATFDTRLRADNVAVGLRLLMGVIGYAAPRMAKMLVAKGYVPIAEPRGFIVTGKEGPLAEGEIERARAWGNELARSDARVPTPVV